MSYLMDTYPPQALALVKGEGCWVWDEEGRKYLDAVAGVATSSLGHNHPLLVDALCRQARELIHVSNHFRIPQQVALAERLCTLSGMDKAFLCNSGAEANEAAIKLARVWGHSKGVDNPAIVVTDKSFHGRTLATLSATGNRKVQAGFEPLVAGFVRVPFGDAEAVRQVAKHNAQVVAVLVEPVQGEGGVNVPPDNYLAELRALCDEQGWLLMLDEVQTGMGRLGSWFGCQSFGVVPDVMALAKGMGGGVPVGACLARGAAASVFKPGMHGSTFGGNPLACAAALAVARAMEDEGLVAHVAAMGERLKNALASGLAGLAGVKEIRGRGLLVGVELDRPCGDLVAAARARGVLINVTAERVVRLMPPLVISEEEIDFLAEQVVAVVKDFLPS